MTSLLMLLLYFWSSCLFLNALSYSSLLLWNTLFFLSQSWVSLRSRPWNHSEFSEFASTDFTPDLITCPWLHYLTSSLNFTPEYVPNFLFSPETLFHSVHQINQIHS